MSNIYFTSDTHFGHKSILEYCSRPFNSVEAHDEHLIQNWNEVVGEKDQVYHLGDLSFINRERTEKILERLNGIKFFVRGNHDKNISGTLVKKHFTWCKDYYELKVWDEEMDVNQVLILCHYPIESWNKKYHGAWHLHGHCHGLLPSGNNLARLDVGVDVHGYFPISYEEVKTIMTKKALKAADPLERPWER